MNELTIIITAHDEGVILERTLINMKRSIEAIRAGTCEILIHADDADAETAEFLQRLEKEGGVKVYWNHFRNLGKARNFMVGKATGKYIAFLKGGDLVSENWLAGALEKAKRSEEIILVHPRAELTFGLLLKRPELRVANNSGEDDVLRLVGGPAWPGAVLARREAYEKVKFRENMGADRVEDYGFEIDTAAVGWKHVVVDGALGFRRVRTEIDGTKGERQNYLQQIEEKLFELPAVEDGMTADGERRRSGFNWRETYRKVRENETVDNVVTPFAKSMRVLFRLKSSKKIEKVLGVAETEKMLTEWKRVNAYENLLYPRPRVMEKLRVRPMVDGKIGAAYEELMRGVEQADYVFVVPWMTKGGAEKVVLNYIAALKEVHSEWKVAVITTMVAENVWRERLSEGVEFIDFGNAAGRWRDDEKDILFTRIMTQLKTKRLHIVNSEYGYLWVARHKWLVQRKKYKINVSLFCSVPTAENEEFGILNYATFVSEIYDLVNKISTDNVAVVKLLEKQNGFAPEKCVVHYQPVEMMEEVRGGAPSRGGRWRILWASRVAEQKCPWLVKEIGKKLDPEKCEIDVYGAMGKGYRKNYFNGVPAIKYKGEFDGARNLPVGDYDLFLYTSDYDGVPNVLLEVMMAGLPVVASDAGGIREVVLDGKTGILVEDASNVDAYVKAIKNGLKDATKLKEYAANAKMLVKKQHDFEQFVKKVRRDID